MRRVNFPRHITVRVDPRTAADFHLLAVNHGLTASAILRDAIRAAIAAPKALAGGDARRAG